MNTKYFYHFGIFIFKYESLNNIFKKKNNKENHDLVNEIKEVKEVKNNNIIIFDNNDENNEYGQYILIDL